MNDLSLRHYFGIAFANVIVFAQIRLDLGDGWSEWSDWSPCTRSGLRQLRQAPTEDRPWPLTNAFSYWFLNSKSSFDPLGAATEGSAFRWGNATTRKAAAMAAPRDTRSVICRSVGARHQWLIARLISWNVLSLKPCPSETDFRAVQCSNYNTKHYRGRLYEWLPYNDPKDPCALTCKAKVFNFVAKLAPRVEDGTRCRDGSLDMCVAGKCLVWLGVPSRTW